MLCVLRLHYGGQAGGAYTIVARRVPARSVADERREALTSYGP